MSLAGWAIIISLVSLLVSALCSIDTYRMWKKVERRYRDRL